MVPAADDTPTDRRQAPRAIRCGRRWRDDADLAPAVEHVLLLLSRDINALRECRDWSQEDMAYAAGISAQALLNIEKTRDDVHISTIVRLAYVAGYEVDIRFRKSRPPNHGLVNQSAPTRP
jgi:DNA-binding XRE family transcriptional regulator